jgi:hypothetical protein
MMQILGFLVLLICCALSVCSATNIEQTFKNNLNAIAGCGVPGVVDLSSLQSSSDLTYSDTTYSYYMNVCGNVHFDKCETGAMACQYVPSQKIANTLAYFNTNPTGQWSLMGNSTNPTGVQAVYTNGPANCFPNSQVRTLNLFFPCQSQADTSMTVVNNGCSYTITYGTPAACSGGSGSGKSSSSGLSGGWIFIIVLLVSFVLYISLGCLYKSKKLGATGSERCPNVDFLERFAWVSEGWLCVHCNKIASLLYWQKTREYI